MSNKHFQALAKGLELPNPDELLLDDPETCYQVASIITISAKMGVEADKELKAKEFWYKEELESYKQASKDEFDKREALEIELEAKEKLITKLKDGFISIALDWNDLPSELRFDEDLEKLGESIKNFPI